MPQYTVYRQTYPQNISEYYVIKLHHQTLLKTSSEYTRQIQHYIFNAYIYTYIYIRIYIYAYTYTLYIHTNTLIIEKFIINNITCKRRRVYNVWITYVIIII